ALFFQFSRVFSIRNLDVLTLYLFVPGFPLLVEASRLLERAKALQDQDAVKEALLRQAAQLNFWGYLWLIGAALYFLARSIADLVLVRRPALGANLNLSGLSWLTGSLFVGLIALAALQPVPSSSP